MADAIVAEGLVKTYGAVRALDGLDLRVREGSVLGLLGPNGAGKTTCVRVLATLLRPDHGSARVGGLDVVGQARKVREIIGLSGQYAAVDENLTGYENLEMFGRLYHLGKPQARQRANELLERFALTEAAGRVVKTYSGGMRRRLDLAGALVTSPPIIFLDEPTTGLDLRSRLGMWDVINERVRSGTTLLLTTQYLEEADQLADEIVVIDHGRAIAQGTPQELKQRVGGDRLEVTIGAGADLPTAAAVLEKVCGSTATVDSGERKVSATVERSDGLLVEAVRQLDSGGIDVVDIGMHRATLDDVFLRLTGQPAEAESADSQSANGQEKT